MTQNSHTQSENRNLQHENWVRVVQSRIETNNQLYMIIEERKSITKQTCIDDLSI